MKRIDYIKDKLCNIINNSQIEDMENILYELQNTELFKSATIQYLTTFDEKYFSKESDEEMSKIIKSGTYNRKMVEWLKEELY